MYSMSSHNESVDQPVLTPYELLQPKEQGLLQPSTQHVSTASHMVESKVSSIGLNESSQILP